MSEVHRDESLSCPRNTLLHVHALGSVLAAVLGIRSQTQNAGILDSQPLEIAEFA